MSYASENRLRSNVKELRLAAGMSQLDLAARSSVALTTIERMDHGEAIGMRIETLLRVAAALEVSPADLFPELGSVTRPDRVPPKRRRVDPVLHVRPRPRPVSASAD